MSNGNAWIIFACLLLLAFLVYLEWKRKKKARLLLRIILSTGAVGSLLLLAVPFTWNRSNVNNADAGAVLITEGYQQDSVRQFLNERNTTYPVYAVDSLRYLDSGITTLHIFGNGLPTDQYKYLDFRNIVFHPSLPETGINAVNWNQNLSRGESLQVEGSYFNEESHPVKILLEGYNTILDSAYVSTAGVSAFRVKTVPRHLGKAIFHLKVVAGNDTIGSEPVPTVVKQPDPINIFMLSGAPAFEHRFLKNWLAANGFPLVTRNRISRDKFGKGFYNTPSFTFNSISPSLISRFDLLIADEAELNSLNNAEIAIIRGAVMNQSMGLLILADSAGKRNQFYHSVFPRVAYRNTPVVSLKLNAEEKKFSLPVEQKLQVIRNVSGTNPLITDSMGSIFISSSLYGKGRVTYSSLPPTFPLMLRGDSVSYTTLWTTIINTTAKKENPKLDLFTSPRFVLPHQEVTLNIRSGIWDSLTVDDVRHPVQQDAVFPELYRIRWWPRHAGWQPPLKTRDEQAEWYVFDITDWQGVKAAQQRERLKEYIRVRSKMKIPVELEEKMASRRIPSIFLFFTFIFCCTSLWVEKKFF